MTSPASKHDVYLAIADPTRRKILKMLANREMPIASISDQFPISRTAVNKHLQILTDAGLVRRQKVGRETRYKLQAEPLAEIKRWLSFFEQYWDERLVALKQFVENDRDADR